VDDGEIKVLDCPAEEMWADVMTKPLQGTAFRIMQVELMNCPINYEHPEDNTQTQESYFFWQGGDLETEITTLFKTPQECVGQNKIRHNKPAMDKWVGRSKYPRGGRVSTLGTLVDVTRGDTKS
jgi:hypothetical protein